MHLAHQKWNISPRFIRHMAIKNIRLEMDFINGNIVELGKRYGVATPYNESVHALVKMLESKN